MDTFRAPRRTRACGQTPTRRRPDPFHVRSYSRPRGPIAGRDPGPCPACWRRGAGFSCTLPRDGAFFVSSVSFCLSLLYPRIAREKGGVSPENASHLDYRYPVGWSNRSSPFLTQASLSTIAVARRVHFPEIGFESRPTT